MGKLSSVTIFLVVGATALGLAAGLGVFTFVYAEGGSYLTDNPAACANCHVMQEQYSAWSRSSHHAVAVCNDCHTPEGVVPKYAAKALNGYHHSLAFTTGKFAEPIRITQRNFEVTEARCRGCHQPIVDQIDTHAALSPTHKVQNTSTNAGTSCIRCHNSVGHLH